MLNEKRIKEAENNIRIYLEDGLLKKTNDKISQDIFIKNAKESIRASKLMLDNKIFLWTIVTSYYSMFYIANAVLLKIGYKTSDKIVHKVTADSLIALIRNKLKKHLIDNYEKVAEDALKIAEIKSNELINSFDYERIKRSNIQYKTSQSEIKTKAITSFKRAQEFLFEMEGLL